MLVRNLNDVKYDNQSSVFLLRNKDFKYQYAPLYAERLTRMRKQVVEATKKKWPQAVIKNLAELTPNEKCVIIGTLFKVVSRNFKDQDPITNNFLFYRT